MQPPSPWRQGPGEGFGDGKQLPCQDDLLPARPPGLWCSTGVRVGGTKPHLGYVPVIAEKLQVFAQGRIHVTPADPRRVDATPDEVGEQRADHHPVRKHWLQQHQFRIWAESAARIINAGDDLANEVFSVCEEVRASQHK